MARKETPLAVRIPTPTEDRPVLSRVGIVAVIGFALGIAWPKLLGAKLGPDAPGSRTQSASSAPASPSPAGTAAAAAEPEDEADEDAGSPVSNKQRVVLSSLSVVRCKDAKGKTLEGTGKDGCAKVAADRWIEPRLRELASCPAAIGLEGDMQLELEIDFGKKSLRVGQGAKPAFPTSTVRGVLKCAGDQLETLELEKIAHTQARVTLRAQMKFVPPGKALEPEAPAKGSAAEGDAATAEKGLGTATVSWEKALLRDTPKDGKVVARVPQGARVTLLEQRQDWYLVAASRGDAKGWVYRQAIGK